MKEKIRAVLDVETTDGFGFPLPYDVSYVIYKGDNMEKLCEKSFVIREIFYNKEKMEKAFYKDKIPSYWRDIWSKKRKPVFFWQMWWSFYKDMKKYQCNEVYAYNADFDRRALNSLIKYCSFGRYKYFFKKNIQVYDIWNMACNSFLKSKEFIEKAEKNNWITDKGNIKTNAEVSYRFINKNNDFEEEHKGLEDCYIEAKILKYCLNIDENLPKDIVGSPWHIVQKAREELKKCA